MPNHKSLPNFLPLIMLLSEVKLFTFDAWAASNLFAAVNIEWYALKVNSDMITV